MPSGWLKLRHQRSSCLKPARVDPFAVAVFHVRVKLPFGSGSSRVLLVSQPVRLLSNHDRTAARRWDQPTREHIEHQSGNPATMCATECESRCRNEGAGCV